MKIYTVQSTVLPLISDNDHFMQVLAISCIFINQSSHSGTIQYIQYCSTELVVLVRAYSTWEQVKIKFKKYRTSRLLAGDQVVFDVGVTTLSRCSLPGCILFTLLEFISFIANPP